MQALVVSAETVAGGEAINEGEGQVGSAQELHDKHHAALCVPLYLSGCV